MTWQSVKLGDIAQLNPRFTGNAKPDDIVSFVPMSSVSELTKSILREEERTFSEVSKGYTPFHSGDIILAKITPCFENGKLALANTSHHYAFGSTEFHVMRTDAEKLYNGYLFNYLKQPWIISEGSRKMTGSAGQRRVPRNFLESLEIPLPPLQEQKRIAAILDKADDLRKLRRDALQKLDDLTQAVFLEMFGDP
ncbi:MAG: restriction endonuclease subunit S, partial [Proteobacteria bacterium]